MTNAVKHGNCNDPSKSVVVRYYVTAARGGYGARRGLRILPRNVPDPTAEENLSAQRPRHNAHAFLRRVCYNRTGNEVWMLKEKSPPPQPTR